MLVDFEEFSIGRHFVDGLVNNEIILVSETLYAVHIPLRKTLKLFLEIPGMFRTITKYIDNLKNETSIVTNIMQADMWKQKDSKNENTIVLTLLLFYDDLETGNPLGSHAGKNKFGALYAMIACLPTYISSKLSSIFLTLLVRTADKKNSSNYNVFKKVIEEINYL